MARGRLQDTDVPEIKLCLISDRRNRAQFQLPSNSEIAALIVGDLALTDGRKDITIESRSNSLCRINELHPSYMALQYTVLFPYGEDGYYEEIAYAGSGKPPNKRMHVTMREYFAYRIQSRLNEGQTLVGGGRLFQQYIVDGYTTIEQQRLSWIRNNQKHLRAELYTNIRDAIFKGDNDPRLLGKRIILPASFTGGPRYMTENYQDVIAICRHYQNPDLFITITANPKWTEIQAHLDLTQTRKPKDRPDIVCRVFKIKLDQLIIDIMKHQHFGAAIAVIYTIEFQKRGLPHAHILLGKIHHVVMKANAPRIFQKKFAAETIINKDGYAVYRRREQPERFVQKGDIQLDNRYVVPYNLPLLLKYKAHINVEWCNKSKAIKYLFKYISKGVDRATIVLKSEITPQKKGRNSDGTPKENEEIQNYLECRYVSACEATWRIFAFDLHYRSLSVQRLAFHLEGKQSVMLDETKDLDDFINSDNFGKTMFTKWFAMNRINEQARTLSYIEFLNKFVWESSRKEWRQRKKSFVIGRMVSIHPTSGELYYMRMLLNIVKGPRSFDDVRTHEGKVYPTYKAACGARGLLDDDTEWAEAMREASSWAMPHQLRQLFITLLLFCDIGNPFTLWESHWRRLGEDIEYKQRRIMGFPELKLTDDAI